ncbi:hypothetical protein JNUCC1_00487 [Lentibacillus sp. JNUCC-1]|uniref:hypothetical protein n=1 Tax=Lentibacillus sp. JNUCC-1 TaxID=2654513 RepID=UPI0012E8598D|nr:hypothetical protein [Lentibacillus sp. JNUCC-1]MUV36683.1 hypothetical protein [Lentibacillus sp. JNUCC-1]
MRKQRDIEKQLKNFPKHRLSSEKKKQIHDQLMQAQHSRTRAGANSPTRKGRIKHITAWAASVAALMLFGLLGGFYLLDENKDTTSSQSQEKSETILEDKSEPEQQTNDTKEADTESKDTETNDTVELPMTMDKQKAKSLMEHFKASLMDLRDTTGQNGELEQFDSKQDVKTHFMKIMTEKLAQEITDAYIEERDGQVYLIGAGAPTWLDPDQAFQLEQTGDGKYTIGQERNDEYGGHRYMTYYVQQRKDQWVVSGLDSESLEESFDIREASDEILQAIKQRDMKSIAEMAHPDKGVLFSPYVYVEENAVNVSKDELSDLMQEPDQRLWGHYDGSGKPIELTPKAYFDEFLDVSKYLNDPDEVLIDDPQHRGNTVNNVKETFPDSKIIEYYDGGSEEYAGIDWSSIILVYEKDDSGKWKLVAVVRDMWTI